jgi:hypothetical protein
MRIRPAFTRLSHAGTGLSATFQPDFIGDEAVIDFSRAHEKLTTGDDRK